jgi:hypothetical protein
MQLVMLRRGSAIYRHRAAAAAANTGEDDDDEDEDEPPTLISGVSVGVYK